jgi:hypothetical protein
MLARLLAVVLVGLCGAAQALTASIEHPYGELVDRGPATVRLGAGAYPFDCDVPADVRVQGRVVQVAVRAGGHPALPPPCAFERSVVVGELAAGWWRFEILVLDAGGAGVVELSTFERRVARPETMCTPYPGPIPSRVIAEHATLTNQQFVERIATSEAYRALLGHPIEVRPFLVFPGVTLGYPPLENTYDLRARLMATGEFRDVSANGPVCFATPRPDTFAVVVEFHHAGLDTFFYSWWPPEIEALDRGDAIRGWTRTGESFRVLEQPGCPLDVPEGVVYRFHGVPGVGPASHFFTALREECRVVDRSGAWTWEGVAFWAVPPDARGGCSDPGRLPLHRLWRPFGESTHRYTTSAATVETMKARGWVHEGVAMCVRVSA